MWVVPGRYGATPLDNHGEAPDAVGLDTGMMGHWEKVVNDGTTRLVHHCP
jgi:hypothetical protein